MNGENENRLHLFTFGLNRIRMFLNIMVNACEAMESGGTLTVTTSAVEGGRSVAVEIADTGTGIPADVLPKVFDPFFTTKVKGTGLGLSVAYGLVSRHQGRIDVQTQPGKGTRMTVFLPTGPT